MAKDMAGVERYETMGQAKYVDMLVEGIKKDDNAEYENRTLDGEWRLVRMVYWRRW